MNRIKVTQSHSRNLFPPRRMNRRDLAISISTSIQVDVYTYWSSRMIDKLYCACPTERAPQVFSNACWGSSQSFTDNLPCLSFFSDDSQQGLEEEMVLIRQKPLMSDSHWSQSEARSTWDLLIMAKLVQQQQAQIFVVSQEEMGGLEGPRETIIMRNTSISNLKQDIEKESAQKLNNLKITEGRKRQILSLTNLKHLLLSVYFADNASFIMYFPSEKTRQEWQDLCISLLHTDTQKIGKYCLFISKPDLYSLKSEKLLIQTRNKLLHCEKNRFFFPVTLKVIVDLQQLNIESQATKDKFYQIICHLQPSAQAHVRSDQLKYQISIHLAFQSIAESQQFFRHLASQSLLDVLSNQQWTVPTSIIQLKSNELKDFISKSASGLPTNLQSRGIQKPSRSQVEKIVQRWQSDLYENLSNKSRHWDCFKVKEEASIKTMIRMYEYARFKIKIMMQNVGSGQLSAHNNQNLIDPYSILCPNIDVLILQVLSKMGEQDLSQQHQRYVRNRRTNANSTHVNVAEEFLKHFRKKYILGTKEDRMIQELLEYFVRDQTLLHQGKNPLKLVPKDSEDDERKKLTLKESFNKFEFFYNSTTCWVDLLSSIVFEFRTKWPQSETKGSAKTLNERTYQSMNKVEQQRRPRVDCLGCSQFYKLDESIQDLALNNVPIKVFSTIYDLQMISGELVDWMVRMLNNGGGVILFDCDSQYFSVFPKGAVITEKGKEEFEQRIKAYVSWIQPLFKMEVRVNFVPILRHSQFDLSHLTENAYTGEELLLKNNEKYIQSQFLQGRYVTRIVLAPLQLGAVYYWKITDLEPLHFPCFKNKKNSNLKARELSRLIKKRIKKQVEMSNFSAQEKDLLSFSTNLLNHYCVEPQKGIPISKMPQLTKEKSKCQSVQSQYSLASIVFLNREYFQQFIWTLKREPERISCQLEVLFSKYRFASSHNSAVLYHDVAFQELMRIVTFNPRYKFGPKHLTIISVTTYLKVLTGINELDKNFQALTQWLHSEFPSEMLRLFKFFADDGTVESYMRTDCKSSTVFMYYLLNNFGHKTHLKNPLHLDKMSEQTRSKRFIEVKCSQWNNQVVHHDMIQCLTDDEREGFESMEVGRKSIIKGQRGYYRRREKGRSSEGQQSHELYPRKNMGSLIETNV